MSVVATWFGPVNAALLGFVHIPDDAKARGAVVLCAPLGQEHVVAYRGVRLAAEQLCAAGLVVVRFDYEGTGDSTGDQLAADAVDRWLNSIAAAVQLARETGVKDVAIVGLRMGALLAAAAVGRCGPLISLALWDPVVNGRSYLRRQAALYRLVVGTDHEDDGVVSIPAAVFSAAAAQSIGRLRLGAFSEAMTAQPLLVAARAGSQDDAVLQKLIDSASVEHLCLNQQEQFLERPSSHFHIPSRSIEQLTTWLARCFPSVAVSVNSPESRKHACVERTSNGQAVFETLHWCGPDELFAIETAAGTPSRSLVLYSPAKEHRVGPARMHVELARTLAESGVQTIRFDRRGTGDSGTVAWDELTPMYSSDSVVDAANIMALVHADPADTTLAGLCVGAWMAVMGALAHRVGSIVLLCPIIWALQTRERKIAAAQQSMDLLEPANTRLSRRQRVKGVLRRRLPYTSWRWLGRRGVTQVPEVTLAALLSREIAVTAVMPPADYAWFIDQRGPEGLTRLRRRGLQPRLVLTEAGDHSLLHRGTRAVAMAAVTEVATGQCAHDTRATTAIRAT